jgi:hypothetical protein
VHGADEGVRSGIGEESVGRGSDSRGWLSERRNGEESKDEAGETSSINEEVAGETGLRTF